MILLVEDEVLIGKLMATNLREAGHEVEYAIDGDSALSVLKSGKHFDLLFTDIQMPGSVDGWALGRHAAILLPDIQIIYATGYSGQPPQLNDNESFLSKPYRAANLLKMIGRRS
jgi:CheY-like chemotaxis protein